MWSLVASARRLGSARDARRRVPWARAAVAGLVAVAVGWTAALAQPADFTATSLETGQPVSLADLRGDVVLLNGWATWCTPCKEEMPYLQDLAEANRAAGLRVVGVNVDAGDADDRVRAYADELDVEFPIWRDPRGEFLRTFRAPGLPHTLLVGRDGAIRHAWSGPLGIDPEQDAALIAAALEDAPAVTPAVAPAVGALGLGVAFAAGLLSFLSPCVFPLVPGYVAVITGLSGSGSAGSTSGPGPRRTAPLWHGLLFVAGFSLVFIALGVTATAFGAQLAEHRATLARVGGVVMLLLGASMLGLVRLPWLEGDHRALLASPRIANAGAFAIGVAFGAGWTPCIGPALATMLALAAASATVGQGALLLAVYSLGLAVPFLFAATAIDRYLVGAKSVRRWQPAVQRVSGALVVLVGLLLLTDSLPRLVQLGTGAWR